MVAPRAIDIVKSGKRPHVEPFDSDKLYQSIRAALLSVRSPDGPADDTAKRVCIAVVTWLGDKSTVTSADLRRKATEHLRMLHPDAAYLYQHHHHIM